MQKRRILALLATASVAIAACVILARKGTSSKRAEMIEVQPAQKSPTFKEQPEEEMAPARAVEEPFIEGSTQGIEAPRTAPQDPDTHAEDALVFDNLERAQTVRKAVERVARTGNAKAALNERTASPTVCILVHATERRVDLEKGERMEDYPALLEKKFNRVSGPAQKTTSIYRATAKAAMNHQQNARILILLCPREEWDTLKLSWRDLYPRTGSKKPGEQF